MAEIIILAERRKARQERRATNVMVMARTLSCDLVVSHKPIFAKRLTECD